MPLNFAVVNCQPLRTGWSPASLSAGPSAFASWGFASVATLFAVAAQAAPSLTCAVDVNHQDEDFRMLATVLHGIGMVMSGASIVCGIHARSRIASAIGMSLITGGIVLRIFDDGVRARNVFVIHLAAFGCAALLLTITATATKNDDRTQRTRTLKPARLRQTHLRVVREEQGPRGKRGPSSTS